MGIVEVWDVGDKQTGACPSYYRGFADEGKGH